MRKITVLGTVFDDIPITEAVEKAISLMDERRGAYAVTPNSEIVLNARRSRKLRMAIKGADIVLADSVGVIIASKILGSKIKNRIPGIDFASALMARMAEEGRSVFLLGAKEGVAEQAADLLCEKYPGLVICGTNDGYFTEYDEELIINRINESEADFLMVCLGSPKQELWMKKHAPELKVGLMAGLGGSLDVFSGNVKRAPRRWRSMGLEWLYRLIKEPWRIKRMIKIPEIIFAALAYRIGGK